MRFTTEKDIVDSYVLATIEVGGHAFSTTVLRATAEEIGKAIARHASAIKILGRLARAADVYSADQSKVKDRRTGLVQPITADEGDELCAALKQAWALLPESPAIPSPPPADEKAVK